MRLISLELENFRQHKSSKIDFNDGITVIMGANGSGKSTILEAISWAIYGTEAARGNKDSIKWNKAPARSKVKVELVFSIDNETYRVIRSLDKADVYVNSSENSSATTQQEVTKFLVDKLGMTRDEFFNTYFTGQKELNFLANQKPVERRKFISKVLDYDKIRIAQEKVRLDKNNLNNELLGLRQGLPDIEQIQSEKEKVKLNKAELSKLLEQKRLDMEKNAASLGKLYPDWMKIKSIKDDYNKFNTELNFVNDKLVESQKNIENLEAENELIQQKEKRLGEIEPQLAEYRKLEKQIQEQEKLQKYEIEKQKYLTNIENVEKELLLLQQKQENLKKSLDEEKDLPEKIRFLSTDIEASKAVIQSRWSEWNSQKQEIKAEIKHKETELNKVASQYAIIEQKGENGECPTCHRALKGEFEKVTSGFKDEINQLSKDLQELTLKLNDLQSEPSIIAETRKSLEAKEQELQGFNKLLGNYEGSKSLFDSLQVEMNHKKQQEQEKKEALKKLPQGFDREVYEKLKVDYSALKTIYDEVLALKAQLNSKDKLQANLQAGMKSFEETQKRKTELETKLKDINYSEEEYKMLEELVVKAEALVNNIKYETVKVEGELNQAQAILKKIVEAENDYKDKFNLIKTRQDELNHLIELDRFYGVFLEKLNNEARPELSEIASEYLQELTEGRYAILELNEKYEICLKEDIAADPKSVISGGEEDIANLCVRLAISKMIAQRSGKILSLLILDEVFGSLDESRRNNVVSLLNSLTNSFEQVILITHIDDIKESIDNVIKVEYNPEDSYSTVITGESAESSSVIELLN